MVLVSQAKFRDRQVVDAFVVDSESPPAGHDFEGRQDEAHMGFEIFPDAVSRLLGVANDREHRQDSFHYHATSPCLVFADFHVRGIARFTVEALVGQHDHAFIELLHKVPEMRVARVGGAAAPRAHAAELIEHEAQFSADNPAFVAQSLLADLLGAASLTDGMDELDAVGVGHAQNRGVGLEAVRPVPMGGEEPEQPAALGQFGKQRPSVPRQPTVECSSPDTFDHIEKSQRHGLAGIEQGLRVFGRAGHDVVHSAEQFDDKGLQKNNLNKFTSSVKVCSSSLRGTVRDGTSVGPVLRPSLWSSFHIDWCPAPL